MAKLFREALKQLTGEAILYVRAEFLTENNKMESMGNHALFSYVILNNLITIARNAAMQGR
jgi:hypothetical protein